MDEISKTMINVKAQSMRNDKYISPQEWKSLKDQEVKRIEGMLSTILLEVTKQD